MSNLTPETLAELRRLLDGFYASIGATPVSGSPFQAYVNALMGSAPALLDAATLLAEIRDQVTRGALCPMCSTGMSRRTVGMVCQICGTDYASPEYANLRRDSQETSETLIADALAVRAERDELAASVARVRGLAELDNKSAWLPAGTKVKRVTNRRDGYESITSMVAVDDLRRPLDGTP